MRIVLYSRVFPPQTGGMERFAFDLAHWLATQGHAVVVLGPPKAEGAPDGSLPFEVCRGPKNSTMLAHLRAADVVHLNGLTLRGEAATLVGLRRPCITHHGYQAICGSGLAWSPRGPCTASATQPGVCLACPAGQPSGALRVQTHRAGARIAATNVCISQYQQRRLGLANARVILDPVGDHAFENAELGGGQDGLLAFAGRLVEEKGLDLLLRALVAVPGARLEVGGDGPMRARWEALSLELNLQTRVRFLGALPFDGVVDLYRRAALICVPSVWDEPFGYAAAEAMAMGRPVVATPRGALVELLEDGRGFVSEFCTPEALSITLAQALSNAEGRRAAGQAARRYAQDNLQMDVVGERYLAAYRASM